MKLQVFDKNNSTSKAGRPKYKTISFYKRDRTFSLSSLVVSDLDISLDHKVLIAKDEDSKNQYYISFSKEHNNGFKLRQKKSGGYNKEHITVICSCRDVVDCILNDFKAEKSATFLLSEKPKQIDGLYWYAIIPNPIKKI